MSEVPAFVERITTRLTESGVSEQTASGDYLKVKAIAEAALDVTASERDAWITQRCAGDSALREDVARWLAAIAAAEAQDFLAPRAVVTPAFGDDAQQRYRVLRELGHGGMGMVYLAERADGEFRQLVALKTLNAIGSETAALAQRLRAERQILAGLQHPNIARLLDGGTDAAGWPWLVMEYVDGERIDRWCDAHGLGVAERIALLLPVCDAVAYAHQHLVVHRDIKPGNILVAADGTPKLLDFGIARLLDEEATATLTADQRLTFRYASPEQIRGDAVGTASDLYSLAVVLYRLLTGQFPYAPGDASAPELARAALDDTPRTPSRSLVAPEAAGKPQTEALARALSGDVDAILLRALRKAPHERYASVAQFAEDLRRHLSGQPVVARQGQRGYALRSFLRRHRYGVAASLLALAGLVAFTALLIVQLDRAERERDRARQVAQFLATMFEDSNPMSEVAGNSAARAGITVREVLDRQAPRIERELAGQPHVQATLLGSIGRVYDGLDQRELSLRYLEAALARLPADDASVARERAELLFYLCKVHGVRGRERTLAACDDAVAAARAIARGPDFDLARALNSRGSALNLLGRNDESEADLRAALTQFQQLGKREWSAGVAGDLAALAYLRGDPKACLAQIEPVVAQWRSSFGSEHAILAGALSTRSNCLLAIGKAKEAEADLREALALVDKAVGADAAVGNRAQLLSDLALVLNRQERFAEAEPLLREALRISEQVYGPDHPEVGAVLRNLSLALDGQGHVEEGIALLRRTLEIDRKRGESDGLSLAITQNNLGFRLVRDGRYAESEPLLRESLQNYERIDPRHPDRAAPLVNLGNVLVDTGRAAEALPLLREGFELRERTMQPGSAPIESARSLLGACLAALGRRDEALPLLRTSYEALLKSSGAEHRRTRDAKKRLDGALR